MTRRLVTQITRVFVYIVLDLLEAAAYFAAIALLTVALGMVLPIPAAFVISLLGVSVYFGYLRARRMERARMRGEIR